jgi:uncharacterized protein (DUF736 family)
MSEGPTQKDWEDRRGWVALFRNKKKTEPKHPDFRGICVLEDGQKVSVAAWKRKTRHDDVFLSVRIAPFQEYQPRPAKPQAADSDDDL